MSASDTNNNITMLVPHISCRDAAKAVDFYQQALGANVVCAHKTSDGRVMHAAFKLGDYMFYMADEFPEHGGKSPHALGGTPVTMHIQVDDCDALYNRAIEAGCTSVMPPTDMFWGDRYGSFKDPFGHQWSVGTTIRKVGNDELAEIIATM